MLGLRERLPDTATGVLEEDSAPPAPAPTRLPGLAAFVAGFEAELSFVLVLVLELVLFALPEACSPGCWIE